MAFESAPTHWSSLFNPPGANSAFTYDFNVRGTNDHRRRGSRRHAKHSDDPVAQVNHQIARGRGRGDSDEDDPVHDIVLGPEDSLLPIDDESRDAGKKHARSGRVTNGDSTVMVQGLTDGGEDPKDEKSHEGRTKVYVRGIADGAVDGVQQDDRKSGEDAKRRAKEGKPNRPRVDKGKTELQKPEDEIAETITPIDPPEKNHETQKPATTDVPKPKETKETKLTAKAFSKSKIIMMRIKTKFMALVTDMRK